MPPSRNTLRSSEPVLLKTESDFLNLVLTASANARAELEKALEAYDKTVNDELSARLDIKSKVTEIRATGPVEEPKQALDSTYEAWSAAFVAKMNSWAVVKEAADKFRKSGDMIPEIPSSWLEEQPMED